MTALVVLLACGGRRPRPARGRRAAHPGRGPRALHDLGAGVESDPSAPQASPPPTLVNCEDFQVMPQVPAPPDRAAVRRRRRSAGSLAPGGQEARSIRITGVEHDTIVAFLSSGCITCQKP
ncbi:MAG: hypothetical protein R2702_17940 [Acidimicrobiales bacterium]